jgi:uncharacterized RDD family membrane protein YckC
MADGAAKDPPAERMRRRLVTPEGVDLGLTLATLGQREWALLIDLLIIGASLIALTVVALLGLLGGGASGVSVMAIIWLLGFFVLRNGYFILFEMGPRAATPGKRITGLRVVARSGGRLTADAVIARNLMREIEIYLPLSFLGYRAVEGSGDGWMTLAGLGWAGLFAMFPLMNKDRLRVGDLLAGTWVINAPRRRLREDLVAREGVAARGGWNFTDEQLEAYGIYELQTLEQVLRDGNPEAMESVSQSIRFKLGFGPVEDDHAFLAAYYEGLRQRLERKLLFGRRRADKHDR